MRSLQRHNSLLNALRARQLEQKSAPESLTNILTAQLQEELDFFLYQCVFEAVFDKSVVSIIINGPLWRRLALTQHWSRLMSRKQRSNVRKNSQSILEPMSSTK